MNALPTRLSRRFVVLTSAGTVLAMAACLAGFIRISFSPDSPQFRWASNNVTFVIQANGSDDIDTNAEKTAVRLAFEAWQNLPDSTISFTEDTSAGSTARTDFDSDDIRMVTWDEDGSSGLFPPGSGVIALTPITASTVDGTIFDADIVFNGQLPFSTRGEGGTFDIQSVCAHEVGHFIGLDHSGGPFATMYTGIVAGDFTARSLCEDDHAGAATIYPAVGTRGRINGSITIQGGAGAAFAQVVATRASTGEFVASAVTNSSGSYTLEGLPAGTYTLFAEPLDGPIRPDDTIGLRGQSASNFGVASFPNTVSVAAGGQAAASWACPSDSALKITGAQPGGLLTAGGGSTTLQVLGTGFDRVVAAQVSGDGVTVLNTQAVNRNRLDVTMVANSSAAPGIRNLQLFDDSDRTVFLTAGVEVRAAPPTIATLAPDVVSSSGGSNLTIEGQGFASGSVVVIGGERASGVSVFGATRIDCVVPAGLAGDVDVVVIRPDGQEGRATDGLEVRSIPVPQSMDPAVGPAAGGTTHILRGSGFAQGAQVFVGGVEAQVTSVSANEIRLVLPANNPGIVDIGVFLGSEMGTLAGGLNYVDAVPPGFQSLTPPAGPETGGTPVTIYGSNFTAGTVVRFDGRNALQVTIESDTEITCVTPAGTVGAAEVRIVDTSTGLTQIASQTFTYQPSAVPPASGGGGGGGGGCHLQGSADPSSPWALLALLGLLVLRRREAAEEGAAH